MSGVGAQAKSSAGLDRTLCTFELADRRFGVDVESVREVTLLQPIEPIPHAPASIQGYVNLRGRIWLVVDPRPVLGLAPATLGVDSRLVLLRPSVGDGVCLLVDKVGDVASASSASTESASHANDGLESRFAPTVLKLEELVWLLDLRELLSAAEKSVADATQRSAHPTSASAGESANPSG